MQITLALIKRAVVALLLVLWTLMGYENFTNLKKVEEFNNEAPSGKLMLFWAEWCPHCLNIKSKGSGEEKAWDKLESESPILTSQGKIEVKNYEESETPPELLNKYEVSGFPSVILLKSDGTSVKYTEGTRSVAAWKKFVKENI